MKHTWILPVALFAMRTTFADGIIDTAYIVETTRPTMTAEETLVVPVAPQYDNRFGFSYDRLVYERIKNDDMYFGLDVWAGLAYKHSRNRHYGAILEAEARVGYNLFYNGRDHFTPLVGAGYLYNNVKTDHHGKLVYHHGKVAYHRGKRVYHHEKLAYATAGFKYSHEFNTVFGWGLNVKGLAGQQVSHTKAKKFAWGVDLGMPITFRFAHYRHWDITLEPGYLYVESNHKHSSVFLSRGTLAYRF